MTQAPERPAPTTYEAPTIETLGTLRTLTRGAGPGGAPIVMATGGGIPGGFRLEAEPVRAAD